MAKHKCKLFDCDGTQLGHELARDFPEETRRFTEVVERIIDTEHAFTLDPANLQVEKRELLCPECRQRKTVNCVGQALDPVTDEFVPCEGGPS